MNKPINYQPSKQSQISHELRIPITGIIGMVHLLSETSLTDEQKEYLQHIITAANRLLILEPTLHAIVEGKRS
ncbi:hypothetical protein BH10PSE19_BH10PSE19_11180 [soil metagenome]